MTYSSYVLKMEPRQLETVLRTGMFTIVQNDFDLVIGLANQNLGKHWLIFFVISTL